MNIEDRNALYKKAVDKWSNVSQFGMVMEECAELIRAVNRFMFRNGPKYDVIDEAVDVSIMLEQLVFMLNCSDEFEATKEAKLKRLAGMLEGRDE